MTLKISVIFLAMLMTLSLVALVQAQGDDIRAELVPVNQVREENQDQERDKILQEDAFRTLRSDDESKFRILTKERLENFAVLRADQIEKIKLVSKERLRVLAELDKEQLENVAALSQTDIDRVSKLDRDRINELTRLSAQRIQAELRRINLVEADEDFRLRLLNEERVKAAEEAIERIRRARIEILNRYEQRVGDAKNLKQQLRECQATDQDCSEIEAQLIAKIKETALSTIERLENHLTELKERLQTAQDLSGEVAQARIERIDTLLETLTELKAEVEAAETKEEINDVISKIRRAVSLVQDKINNNSVRLMSAIVKGVVHRIEIQEKKLDCTLANFNYENTTRIDTLVDEYVELISQARDKLDQADDAYDPEDKSTASQAKSLVKEASDLVQEAQQKLVDIRTIIVQEGGTICTQRQEIAVDNDSEEIEEIDEEEDEDLNDAVLPKSEYKTTAKLESDFGNSEAVESSYEAILDLLKDYEGTVKMHYKVEKDDDGVKTEEDVDGSLPAGADPFWEELKDSVMDFVTGSDGEGSVQIEIEHKHRNSDSDDGSDDNESGDNDSDDNDSDDDLSNNEKISGTLEEGETDEFDLAGEEYEIRATFIGGNEIKISINDEPITVKEGITTDFSSLFSILPTDVVAVQTASGEKSVELLLTGKDEVESELDESQTATINVGDQDYEVQVTYVDEDEVRFLIDGEIVEVDGLESEDVNDNLEIRVTSITEAENANETGSVEFELEAKEEVTFRIEEGESSSAELFGEEYVINVDFVGGNQIEILMFSETHQVREGVFEEIGNVIFHVKSVIAEQIANGEKEISFELIEGDQ